MALTITLGDPISAGDTVTAQTLHNLIETASISGLTGSDLSGQSVLLRVAGSAPNPTNFPFWFEDSAKDRVFRVFASPWDTWLTAGPDRFEIALKNGSATTQPKGALVVASGLSEFTVATNPSRTVLGLLQATTPTGTNGPVCIYGICWAAWASAHSGFHNVPSAGEHLVAHHVPAGLLSSNESANPTDPFFGIWIEDSGTSEFILGDGSGAAGRCLFFGPRNL